MKQMPQLNDTSTDLYSFGENSLPNATMPKTKIEKQFLKLTSGTNMSKEIASIERKKQSQR